MIQVNDLKQIKIGMTDKSTPISVKKEPIGLGEWVEVGLAAHNFSTEPIIECDYLGLVDSPMGGKDIQVRKIDGSEVVLYGKKALLSQFKRVEVGDRVRVECLGKKQSTKSQWQYVDFKVYVKKQPSERK